MESLTRETIRTLIQPHEPPCISLYQPTHRHHPDNQQDPIRFKNLVRVVEETLRQKAPASAVNGILEPFKKLGGDTTFWKHTLDGLAVLATPSSFQVFTLQRPVKELVLVADSLHIKPLLRVTQSADRFQVLCLTRTSAKVYEGNRYALDVADSEGFPGTITEVLGEELTDPHRTVASYGQGAGGPAMHHGHGGRTDEVDKDTERFFRGIDREVASRFSATSGLPLVLAALTQHHSVFRSVSQNSALLPVGVEGNPEAMTPEQLRAAVWQVVEPQYLERLGKLIETYSTAVSHRQGTADLSDAARAAIAGRINTLLVESDKMIPGRLDPTTGAIRWDNIEHPEVENLLDDLAETVLRTGGEVVVVPADRMPTDSGLAATYKF